MKTKKNHDTGFAQVFVIVSLVLVSSILTSVLSTSHTSNQHTALVDRTVRANIAAGSAFRRVATAIEDPTDNTETDLVTSDVPLVVDVDDLRVAVTLEGEAGKINPARAASEILDRYLAALPLTEQDRSLLASDLSASRQTDDGTAGIAALKRVLIPHVGPLQIDQDFSALNSAAGIDPQYANSRVLSALPDLDAAEVAQILSMRRTDPSSIAGMSSYFGTSARVFSVVAEIAWEADRSFIRRIPFEITPAGKVRPLAGFLGAN